MPCEGAVYYGCILAMFNKLLRVPSTASLTCVEFNIIIIAAVEVVTHVFDAIFI